MFRPILSLHPFSVPLLMLLGLVATGCAKDSQVIGQANQFHSGLEPAVVEDPVLADYLQQVGDRIIVAARETHERGRGPAAHKSEDAKWMFSEGVRFHFVNSKTLNAFTTGGEHMYIYTELFRQCKTEDELAAVMAHEFAHIYGRHVQKGMNRQMGLAGAALVAGGAGYAAGGAEQGGTYASALAGAAAMAGSFVGKSFTRRDENEADKYGFIFYTRAGWDPEKFDDFFQTMIDKGYDKTPAIASDHPTLASRVQATQRRIGELPRDAGRWARPPVASGAEFQRLQQRAAEVGQRMPDDQSLARSQQLLGALPRSCFTAQDGHIPDQRQSQQRLLEDLQREQAARQRQQQAAQPQQQTTRQQTTTRQQVRRRQG